MINILNYLEKHLLHIPYYHRFTPLLLNRVFLDSPRTHIISSIKFSSY